MQLNCYHNDLFLVEEYRGRRRMPYRKTYEFAGDVIDQRHGDWLHAPLHSGGVKIEHRITGSLRREDAAKLYELARFASGPILELGTSVGLSAYVMASATTEAIDTVELDGRKVAIAIRNLAGTNNVACHTAEAGAWLRAAKEQGQRYGMAFIDHSHRDADVKVAASYMRDLLSPGAFVAFHDFHDPRNFSDNDDYGVFSGAIEGVGNDFKFYGAFGCTGVFRHEPVGHSAL